MANVEAILKKKLAPPRSAWTALHPVERYCREEMPRRAEDRLGLEAEVVSVTIDYLARDALVDMLGDGDLMFLYAAADGPVGIVSADAMLLASLIEVQMLGRVLAFAREDRAPSSTDGIIARPMLSDWTGALSEYLPMSGPANLGSRIPDVRSARLTLDDGHFRVLTVTLDLGHGQRQGRFAVACPEIVVSSDRHGPSQHETLRRHLQAIETQLTAVIATVPKTMDEVTSFQEGDVLALPDDALSRLTLVAPEGDIIATARLGKMDRKRAVRLTSSKAEGSGKAPTLPPGIQAIKDGETLAD